MGGTGADFARAIDVDGAGNIFVAGNFNGNADFDPGPGTYSLASAGGYDFFVVKLTQTSSLSLAASSVRANSPEEQTVSTGIGSSDVRTETQEREESTAKRRCVWAVAVDAALEESDDCAWAEFCW